MSERFSFSILGSPSAAFWISGPDANTFLNGQFTQELKIPSGRVAYGLWLTAKGKVVGDSEILRLGNEEHVVLALRTGATVLRARLEQYLVADEVTIEDRTQQWAVIAAWGPGADTGMRPWAAELGVAGAFARLDGAFVWAERGGGAGHFLALVPERTIAAWRGRFLAAGATEASAENRERDRIRAGIPAVPADIGPGDLPNEGGLEAVAISFTKGCYLGQEVIARLHHLGQVRRRLFRLRGTGAVPLVGTPLVQRGQRVGETRTAVPADSGWIGFGLLSLLAWERGAPLSAGAAGAIVEVADHG